MNDEELVEVWEALAPTMPGRRRIETRVSAWLDAHDTSLAAEWLGLFRVEPFAALALTAVSGIAVLAATPIMWLLRGLM